jgi:hypothetical protein
MDTVRYVADTLGYVYGAVSAKDAENVLKLKPKPKTFYFVYINPYITVLPTQIGVGMPAKEKRKIIPIGEGGRAITLPKPFVDYHELKPKDEVQILYDNILVVKPEGVQLSEEKEKLLRQLLE